MFDKLKKNLNIQLKIIYWKLGKIQEIFLII